MRTAWKIVLVLVLAGVAWAYFQTGTPRWGTKLTLKDATVTSIELYWSSAHRTITASNQCAQVIQIMRKARKRPSPLTPPFGSLTLYYADGTTNRFFLQPSDRSSGLQLIDKSGAYVISMGEMLGIFERVGLLTRDRK